MVDYLFVYLTDFEGDEYLCSSRSEGERLLSVQEIKQSNSVVVVMPGEQVRTEWVKLPVASRDAIKSMRFQLEPVLAGNIDDYRFFECPWGVMKKAPCYPVVYADDVYLQKVSSFIDESNWNVQQVIADYWLVSQENPVVQFDGVLLFHKPGMSGKCLPTLSVGDIAEGEEVDDVSFESLTSEYKGLSGFSLIKVKKEPASKLKPLAVLSAALLVSFLFVNLFLKQQQISLLTEEKQRLSAKIDTLFVTVLPEKRKVRPVLQLEQALGYLQGVKDAELLFRVLDAIATYQNQLPAIATIAYDQEEKSVRIDFEDALNADHQQLLNNQFSNIDASYQDEALTVIGNREIRND